MDRMSWSMKPVCVVRVRMCESLCVCVCVHGKRYISQVQSKESRGRQSCKLSSFNHALPISLSYLAIQNG